MMIPSHIVSEKLKGHTGVIHVGAHDGGEIEFYLNLGFKKSIWVEANPSVYNRLLQNVANYSEFMDSKCFNFAASDNDGDAVFNITNNDSASSSILKLKTHSMYYPHVTVSDSITVKTTTLDNLFLRTGIDVRDYTVLNMDIQGAELLALRGADKLVLQCINLIYLEVNFEELYEGCALVGDIDEFLSNHGFKRTVTEPTNFGWGDAIYERL